MTCYVVGEITLKTQDWVIEYLGEINAFIHRHGGRVLSRTVKLEKVEGDRVLPTNIILIEFPDRDAAMGFFDDPAYQPLRKLRQAGSVSDFVLFPAEDLALQALS